MDLTINQFNARLTDVFEIHSHFNGEGKGRIKRERIERTKSRIAGKGVRPPGIV